MAFTMPRLRLVKAEHKQNLSKGPTSDTARHVLYVERLFHEYHVELSSYVACMLPGNQQDIGAVLQHTYIKLLLQDSHTLLQPDPRPYLFAVATAQIRHALRNYWRAGPDAGRLDPSSTQGSAAWQASLAHIKTGLLELEGTSRQVFLLCRFQEQTYSEIAKTLGLGIEAVERNMSLAYQALLDKLESPRTTQSVRAQAADWFAQKGGGAQLNSADTTVFARWFAASAQHQLAFEQCANLWAMTSYLRVDADVSRELNHLHGDQSLRWCCLRQLLRVLFEALRRQ
jgi:DNA-directed RNA polymerase specialized sigma24 family protein